MDAFLNIVGKVVVKVCMNVFVPGSGAVVDFAEATHDLMNGNYISAVCYIGSGVLDISTLGTTNAAKEIAKEAAEDAAKSTAKQAAKSATKQIGEETAKEIAKGVPKRVAIGAAKQAAKAATKEIGRDFGKELGKGMLQETTEEAFKKTFAKEMFEGAAVGIVGSGGKDVGKEMFGSTLYNVLSKTTEKGTQAFASATSDAAFKVARTAADEYYWKVLKRDLAFNTVKGFAKRCQNEEDG